ncbi:HAD-IIB family hydrolase [Palleronia sediminis]|uniref:HAD-IIB family hydrolase n=1 Tax=Palleronia sediminis TaxID=2547833 RepID=A0A4R6AK27_9RHOB|nr:HAD-IIB family hydrolase [Palleronia sediminis]TDL81813.1 HAD-IIB family hydrolase [Palleronia sediminis]
MNAHTPIDRDISSCRFVLATDLDGTFLGGTEDQRRTLYDWIEENRQTVGLIFVTGRDPKFIVELCEDGLPWPEYVVGDVGTTIARVLHGAIDPIDALEEEIAEAWNDSGDRVRDALQGAPGLTLQPTAFRYRVSYDMDPEAFDRATAERVEEMGLDWIASDAKFFDVLPPGISKGPSIKRLVSHLGISPNQVLCAGDTLNDLSMLECGLPAVAVGGSEAALVDRVAPLHHTYIAKARGAAGILEAVRHFDLHETP